MLEQGRCASGSSSCFCGTASIGLVAICLSILALRAARRASRSRAVYPIFFPQAPAFLFVLGLDSLSRFIQAGNWNDPPSSCCRFRVVLPPTLSFAAAAAHFLQQPATFYRLATATSVPNVTLYSCARQ